MLYNKNISTIPRIAKKKWSGFPAPSESHAYLFGVERRCRFTGTFSPLSIWRVCGFTGTIFFPALVFAITLSNLKTCNVQVLRITRTDAKAKTSPNLRGIFNFLKGLTFFNIVSVFFSKICSIFAAELKHASSSSNENTGGRFVSAHHTDSFRLLNLSGNRPKAFIGTGKLKGSTVFSFLTIFYLITCQFQ